MNVEDRSAIPNRRNLGAGTPSQSPHTLKTVTATPLSIRGYRRLVLQAFSSTTYSKHVLAPGKQKRGSTPPQIEDNVSEAETNTALCGGSDTISQSEYHTPFSTHRLDITVGHDWAN